MFVAEIWRALPKFHRQRARDNVNNPAWVI